MRRSTVTGISIATRTREELVPASSTATSMRQGTATATIITGTAITTITIITGRREISSWASC